MVAQGYTQVKGLDFGETYASVIRLKAIRILLAYACAHNLKQYQMDVKSAFLNGYINEEVSATSQFWKWQEAQPCLQAKKGIVWFEASI